MQEKLEKDVPELNYVGFFEWNADIIFPNFI